MLTCFDVTISDAVDNLKKSIEWMGTNERNADKLSQENVPTTTLKEYVRRPFHCGNGGIVEQKTTERFKVLLCLAAGKFLNHAQSCFNEEIVDEVRATTQVFEFSKCDDEATCLKNKNRM